MSTFKGTEKAVGTTAAGAEAGNAVGLDSLTRRFTPSGPLSLLRSRPISCRSLPAAALIVAGALLLMVSGCRTNVYILGPAPDRLTILNGTFWRSAGGEGATNVSNQVSGGGSPQLKVSP